MALEDVRGTFRGPLAERFDVAVGDGKSSVVEHVQAVRNPCAAELDGGDPKLGKPAEEVAQDQGSHRVQDRSVTTEQRHPEGLVVHPVTDAVSLPQQPEGVVVGIAAPVDVIGHGDVGLLNPGPERVPRQVRRGAAVGRARAKHDQAGTPLQHGLELLGGLDRVKHRDGGGGNDAVLVTPSPVLLQPSVERVKELVGHAQPSRG